MFVVTIFVYYVSDKIKEKMLESNPSVLTNQSSDVRGVEYYRERLQMWNRIWDDTLNRKISD